VVTNISFAAAQRIARVRSPVRRGSKQADIVCGLVRIMMSAIKFIAVIHSSTIAGIISAAVSRR
jgi:hypothetical protein